MQSKLVNEATIMPRRRPDKVVEHRISLSDFERTKINQVQKIAAANVGLDAVTGVAMAAGTALAGGGALLAALVLDRKSTRLNSSHGYISYAVFCLKKKNTTHRRCRTALHPAAQNIDAAHQLSRGSLFNDAIAIADIIMIVVVFLVLLLLLLVLMMMIKM